MNTKISGEFDTKKPNVSVREDLIYIATNLNDHLVREISIFNNQKCTNVSDRLLRLVEVTVKMNELAFIDLTDIETVIKNSVS